MTPMNSIARNIQRPSPHEEPLTPEDWSLIVEALSAYQHHSAFRAVYEKITHLRTPRGVVRPVSSTN